ncbi:MAG: cysteine desulfurase [Bacilli bacterium]|nr:cysteine desulfurase [Bacilli bacterium]
MPTDKIIYLDNAATSKVDQEVLDSFNQISLKYYANPSSIHHLGQEANRLLEKSREQILKLLSLSHHDVIFTSGATEANNLALKGYAYANRNRGNHLITTATEHPSVLNTLKKLEEEGFNLTILPVNEKGQIEVNSISSAIRDDTILISVMAVNNETGAINPIKEIGEIIKKYPKIAFHVDMVQTIGKVDVPLENVDMLSIAGHKIHGLLGSGVLIKEKKIILKPLLNGGGQENNLRSGTNTLALSASFAKALRIAIEHQKENYKHVKSLADYLLNYLKDNPDKYVINSSCKDNPYIVNFSLKKHKASVVVEALSNRNIMVSSLSACHSKGEDYSYVVYAMNKDMCLAHNTIRVSFSYENTLEEVETLTKELTSIIKEIKQ